MTPISTPRLALVGRALRLRCPHCGQRGAIHRWFTMRTICPRCGISLTAGNSVGANLLNLVIAEAVLLTAIVGVVVTSWPDPPWTLLQYGAPVLMLLTPLVFFPFSRLLFVAIDLAMHPGASPDVRVHGIGNSPK